MPGDDEHQFVVPALLERGAEAAAALGSDETPPPAEEIDCEFDEQTGVTTQGTTEAPPLGVTVASTAAQACNTNCTETCADLRFL